MQAVSLTTLGSARTLGDLSPAATSPAFWALRTTGFSLTSTRTARSGSIVWWRLPRTSCRPLRSGTRCRPFSPLTGGTPCRTGPTTYAVSSHYSGELDEPWRWRKAGNDALGAWLAAVRESLLEGRAVDPSSRPDCVSWVRLRGGKTYHGIRVTAARCRQRKRGQTALIIGDSKSKGSRHQIAKSVSGVTTIEPVDLGPLTDFATRLESEDGQELQTTLDFASRLMTKVRGSDLLKRLEILKSGRARKAPDDVEQAARCLCDAPTPAVVADLLEACARRPESRVYRPEILWPSIRALRLSRLGPDRLSCLEAAIKIREERRGVGRWLPKHAIGSTLLLKGLEADHAVVLNANDLDAKNLYVALTRASRTVTVCSPSAEITPPKPT